MVYPRRLAIVPCAVRLICKYGKMSALKIFCVSLAFTCSGKPQTEWDHQGRAWGGESQRPSLEHLSRDSSFDLRTFDLDLWLWYFTWNSTTSQVNLSVLSPHFVFLPLSTSSGSPPWGETFLVRTFNHTGPPGTHQYGVRYPGRGWSPPCVSPICRIPQLPQPQCSLPSSLFLRTAVFLITVHTSADILAGVVATYAEQVP